MARSAAGNDDAIVTIHGGHTETSADAYKPFSL